MKSGILIIAHNNRTVDYAKMAIISAGLAKKHLNQPVSLITDQSTLDWLNESGDIKDAESVFENIILTERPEITNFRKLSDGDHHENIPFINANRSDVFNLTPYDRTLLIDADYLIFSDSLSPYWEADSSVMIGQSFNDVMGERVGFLDQWVSETGISMKWATTVMFTKNQEAKSFFDLVSHVKEHYKYYADLYRFDPRQYRNDISFSIAKHILNGFEDDVVGNLPPVLTVIDTDTLIDVTETGALKFTLADPKNRGNYLLCALKDQDVHIMNKQNIIRQYDKLRDLI